MLRGWSHDTQNEDRGVANRVPEPSLRSFACQLSVEQVGREPLSLHTAHRAAVELLTDAREHVAPVIA